jgi:minor extracellular serine protease Vpr
VTLQATGVSVRVPYMALTGGIVANNVVPFSFGFEGTPGQDAGPAMLQIVDMGGVPLTGQPVTFTEPSGAVTFQNATGTTSTCSPAGSSSVTCKTDNYGVAYAEVILGAKPALPTITARASGNSFSFPVEILPQPAIAQVIDNAAYLQMPVAPGSYIAIKGSNLMNPLELLNTAQGYDLVSTAAFPLSFDGVNVSFDVPSAKISVPAPVYFACPSNAPSGTPCAVTGSSQINVQVPWELEGQTSAQVKVIIDEAIDGTVVTVPLANYAPAFFFNSGNVADAIDTNGHLVTSSNPAVPGQYVQLYANGLGPVNSPPADGAPIPLSSTAQYTQAASTTTPCTVSIGSQQAQVAFCGIAPFTPGEYQVNVQVPTNLSAGNQPITISVGGATSPSGFVIPVQ